MNYLIPANSKSGQLLFGIFRPVDLIIFGSGIALSLLLMLIVSPNNLGGSIICLLPVGVCSLLIIPVPNYHNILVVLTELFAFLSNRRNYKWEGWCYKDEYK